MKIRLFMAKIFFLFSLVACTHGAVTYDFKGYTDNWVIDYKVNVIDDKRFLGEYFIKFIGEDNQITKFDYEFKNPSLNIGEQNVPFDKKNKVYSGNTECTESELNEAICRKIIDEKEKVIVLLRWNGKVEKIELELQR